MKDELPPIPRQTAMCSKLNDVTDHDWETLVNDVETLKKKVTYWNGWITGLMAAITLLGAALVYIGVKVMDDVDANKEYRLVSTEKDLHTVTTLEKMNIYLERLALKTDTITMEMADRTAHRYTEEDAERDFKEVYKSIKEGRGADMKWNDVHHKHLEVEINRLKNLVDKLKKNQ